MVVITKGSIHAFVSRNSKSAIPLNDWYEKTKSANRRNYSDVKLTFNSVDAIGNDRYVFNIGGNNFRIITMIHFNIRTVYIRGIFTHKDYDLISKSNKLTSL
jgi:mRNA interferase HigB